MKICLVSNLFMIKLHGHCQNHTAEDIIKLHANYLKLERWLYDNSKIQ